MQHLTKKPKYRTRNVAIESIKFLRWILFIKSLKFEKLQIKTKRDAGIHETKLQSHYLLSFCFSFYHIVLIWIFLNKKKLQSILFLINLFVFLYPRRTQIKTNQKAWISFAFEKKKLLKNPINNTHDDGKFCSQNKKKNSRIKIKKCNYFFFLSLSSLLLTQLEHTNSFIFFLLLL